MTTKTTTPAAALDRAKAEYAEAQAALDAATEQHLEAVTARDELLRRAGAADPKVTPAMVGDARTAVDMAAAVVNAHTEAVRIATAAHRDAAADALAARAREEIGGRVAEAVQPKMEELARYVMAELASIGNEIDDYNDTFWEIYRKCQYRQPIAPSFGGGIALRPHPDMIERGILADKTGAWEVLRIDGDNHQPLTRPDADTLAHVVTILEAEDHPLAA